MSLTPDQISALAARGITVEFDPPGGIIFRDAQGNQIYDFSGGMGPQGVLYFTEQTLNESYDLVKDWITGEITDNQALAIANLVTFIGAENFINSALLTSLNDIMRQPAGVVRDVFMENVSRMFLPWHMDANGQPSQYLLGMREWERQLFLTPDEMPLPERPNVVAGDNSFFQAAEQIRIAREEYFRTRQ